MKNTVRQYARWIMNIVIAVIILLLLIYALPVVLGLFMPFVIGWIIAMIANPLVQFLEKKLKIKRKALSVIVIVLVIGAVVAIGYFAIGKLVNEAIGFFSSLPDIIKGVETEFKDIGNNLSGFYNRLPSGIQSSVSKTGDQITKLFGTIVGNISTPTISSVGSFAKNIPTLIIAVIMCLLSSYAFIADREPFIKWLKEHVPAGFQEKWNVMYSSMKHAVGGYFKAQLIIEIWVYLILAIGLAILNVKYALLIALLIAILDFLPVFGAGAVMVPWAVIKFLGADYKMAVGLLIIWGVGQLVRQIIQPKIMGDSIGFDMIPTLILLYIGYKLYGVLGMIIILPIGIIVMNMDKAGIFDTTKNSVKLLVKGINDFRKLTPEEIESVSDRNNGAEESRQDEVCEEDTYTKENK